jgi:hypothetical protein
LIFLSDVNTDNSLIASYLRPSAIISFVSRRLLGAKM